MKKRSADNIRFARNIKGLVVINADIFDLIVKMMVEPDYKPIHQYNFKVERFKPDAYIKELKLAFEFDGDHHYDFIRKMIRDDRKMKFYRENNIKSIHYPYYLNPTKDVIKHIFGTVAENIIGINFYSDEKYDNMLKQCFKVNDEKDLLGCGFHKSDFTPATWQKRGVDRFIREVYTYPESVRSQIRHSLNLYLKDVEYNGDKREWLVLPDFPHEDFQKFMSEETKKEHLNHIFLRQPEVVK